ncbi:MAG: cyclic pyranopterin monophosphate synthase MoaC [Halobacteriaceae archaeon]
MDEFAHVEDEGTTMVDVTDKPDVYREAVATGTIDLQPSTVAAVRDAAAPKDDVLATARVAAIQAVKRTWDDVPMCHQVPVTDVSVDFDIVEDRIDAEVSVTSTGKTGVEMEALNGVTRALLTLWDMVKSAEKTDDGGYPDTAITDVRVERKVTGEASE